METFIFSNNASASLVGMRDSFKHNGNCEMRFYRAEDVFDEATAFEKHSPAFPFRSYSDLSAEICASLSV